MNTRLKRIIPGIAISLMVLWTAACGNNTAGNDAPNAQAPTPKKEAITLTLATFNEWAKAEGLNESIKLYEEATGNKVQLDVYPDDQFLNVLKTKISTNDAPDLFLANLGESYVPYTLLEPLTGPWVDVMEDSVKKIASKEGSVYMAYAFPLGFLDVIYNKAVFKKAGIRLPLTTYQQLLEACEALQAIGVTPIFMPGKDGWTYEMIPALGGVYALKNNPDSANKLIAGEAKPSEIPAFKELADRSLALTKYFNENHMSAQTADGYEGLLNGEYGMAFLGDWLYDDFAKANPDKIGDTSMMPVTLGDDYVSAISNFTGRAFGVPANAKHKDEAKRFIDFVLEPEHFKTIVKPFKGASPYKGYENEMNPWQQDMTAMLNEHNIPITDSYLKQAVGSFQMGDTWKPWLGMFAGKAVNIAYDDWYKDYQRLNKAQKTPGW